MSLSRISTAVRGALTRGEPSKMQKTLVRPKNKLILAGAVSLAVMLGSGFYDRYKEEKVFDKVREAGKLTDGEASTLKSDVNIWAMGRALPCKDGSGNCVLETYQNLVRSFKEGATFQEVRSSLFSGILGELRKKHAIDEMKRNIHF